MASENNLTAVFTDIANAIRDKKGSVNTIKPINMADEILTIGDTNFKDLVERKITNIDDDTIISVGEYAFYNCKNLTTANFKSAKNVLQYSFEGCLSLANVNFTNVINIKWNVFLNCSSLKTLTLRANQVCTLSNINTFNGTPIATSTTEGYIYVPLSLTENYRSATNWTTYKSKIMPIDLLEGNYVEVDLGTLNWFMVETGGFKVFYTSGVRSGNDYYMMCSKYLYANDSTTRENLQIRNDAWLGANLVYIIDNNYTDPTAFKNAMSGVILKYLP